MKPLHFMTGLFLWTGVIYAQEPLFRFGEEVDLQRIISGGNMEGVPVNWIQVNTVADAVTRPEPRIEHRATVHILVVAIGWEQEISAEFQHEFR